MIFHGMSLTVLYCCFWPWYPFLLSICLYIFKRKHKVAPIKAQPIMQRNQKLLNREHNFNPKCYVFLHDGNWIHSWSNNHKKRMPLSLHTHINKCFSSYLSTASNLYIRMINKESIIIKYEDKHDTGLSIFFNWASASLFTGRTFY